MTENAQRLASASTSPDIAEALAARVADPLWIVARQWQMGEFEAENGGSPALVIVTHQSLPLSRMRIGGDWVNTPPERPLESLIEAERGGEKGGRPRGWNTDTLSYDAHLTAGDLSFDIQGYDGRSLDWYDFRPDKLDDKAWSDVKMAETDSVPGMLGFPGAPEPRWWTIEDGAAYFDSAVDPEPNVLSMLLPEFFYADVRNWSLAPAPVQAGHVRRIDKVEVVDSFGVITRADPVPAEETRLFSLGGETAGAELFLSPQIAAQVVDCDTLEEVNWYRDEAANMVWAHERTITDDTGTHDTGTEMAPDTLSTSEAGRYFTFKNDQPRAYIPYVPRQRDEDAASGVALRRGRTQIDATVAAPQHRSNTVAEATWVNQEDIAPNGLRTRRLHRYARGADGKAYFWIGRDRQVAIAEDRVRLAFDYLRDETAQRRGQKPKK
ncbi:hypothetical protein [uncultured Tateyamaria sp.]|uniref:hypothetical protein n=1 Tax=Tateyamaria sp. 1078 TaxID=3417464 RepID=UPI0026344943|nr:hypothetical protein [uncultured Tateyamaria sp.]